VDFDPADTTTGDTTAPLFAILSGIAAATATLKISYGITVAAHCTWPVVFARNVMRNARNRGQNLFCSFSFYLVHT